MSTYSTNLKIELITPGTQAGVWGTTTNTNLGTLVEQAISGIVTQAITDGADTVITIPDGATGVARNMVIECVGALTAARNLIVPTNKKLYFIYNNTTGGYAVTVKVSGQTGISVPNGAKVILMMNSGGTDIVTATNYMATLSLGSALPVLSGGTGTTTSTGSGSVVLSTTPTLTTPALVAETYSTSATVSAAGTVQGDATALTSDYNIITTVASGAGVILPTATVGRRIIIVNKDAADAVKVYPATGAAIDALGANVAFSLPVNGWLELDASSTTQWYSSYNARIAVADTATTATTATNATNLVTTNFSISESGGVLAFIAHPVFTASIASTTMTVTSASAGYVVYGATLTGTGVTGGTTVGAQLTSTETAAASPTYSSGGAIGEAFFVVSSTSGVSAGQMISGLGIPTGTFVRAVDGTTVYLGDRTGADVSFTVQAAGTYTVANAAAKGTYTVSASQTVSSTSITGTKTIAQLTNTGVFTIQP